MYCPVIYGYRDALARHLHGSPTLNAEYIEALNSISQWEEYNVQLPSHRATCLRRALYCGSLVSQTPLRWPSWTDEAWAAVLRSLSLDKELDLRVIDENMRHAREDLSIENAEYLLTHDRGASQVRSIQLGNMRVAYDVARRVVADVHCCARGDPYTATRVGTATLTFLLNLPNLSPYAYMTLLRRLHLEVSDGKSRR
jgi:hypothetical protein